MFPEANLELIPAERRLVLLEPDEARGALWQAQFGAEFECSLASGLEDALSRLQERPCDVVVASLRASLTWPLEALRRSGELQPLAARLLVCDPGGDGALEAEALREAINRARIHRLVLEPSTAEERQVALSGALREVEQRRENARLLEQFIDEWTESREREIAMGAQLERLVAQVQRLESEALRDPLTGLYNETLFNEQLDREVARSQRHRRPLTLLLMGLEGLDAFHARHGRERADLLLCDAASRLATSMQPAPGRPRRRLSDLPFRLSRAEFALLLPETALAGGRVVASRLCQEIAALPASGPDWPGGGGLRLHVGLAEGPLHAAGRSELLREAEHSLGRARASGRALVAAGEPD